MRPRKRYQVGGLINKTGYLKGAATNQNPVNVIPSSHITTENMIAPIYANGIRLEPNTGEYHFPHPFVVETKAKKRWGGKTITTPQYLTTYPNEQQPMKRSFRGKTMRVGGQHFDPQLGNYTSGIYATGGLTPPGYPYAGYNDSARALSGIMMQAGGITNSSAAGAINSGYENASYLDDINGILAGKTKMSQYANPTQNQLAMQAYIWRKQNVGRSPEQTIQGFFDRPSTAGSSADSLRGRLGIMGYGPVAMYNNTPNIAVNPGAALGKSVAAYLWGGDVPDARNQQGKGGGKARPITTSRFLVDPEPFPTYDWTTTPTMAYKKGGSHWIQGAINPAHKGYCTPMSKPTCTGHRRALALMFKHKHGFHKKEEGGYLQGMEMQQGGYPPNYTPAGPVYNMGSYGSNWAAPLTASDSASYLRDYNEARNNPNEALKKITRINNIPERNRWIMTMYDPKRPWGSDSSNLESLRHVTNAQENYQNAYEDANTPGTLRLNLPRDIKRKRRGGYQIGGLTSFTPAGSNIDQNQWSILNPQGITSPMESYRKSALPSLAPLGATNPRDIGSQFGVPNQGSAGTLTSQSVTATQRAAAGPPTPHYGRTFGQVNPTNLSWLLPLNAGLSAAAQNNQYHQLDSWRRNNLNNPLSTLGYADGRPSEVRYGYQYGGINQQPAHQYGSMPFAGRSMKLWQHGGDTGAALRLRPYMLHQGQFQAGGLLDQWDTEDAQDQDVTSMQEPVTDDEFNTDDQDLQQRADLSNDDDYQNALQIAMGDLPDTIWNTNPYLQ